MHTFVCYTCTGYAYHYEVALERRKFHYYFSIVFPFMICYAAIDPCCQIINSCLMLLCYMMSVFW